MAYQLAYTQTALNDLDRLDKATATRIVKKLERLAENAEIVSHYALKGEWSGHFRLRVGDYRVIYEMDSGKQIITVERVEHRSKVYKE